MFRLSAAVLCLSLAAPAFSFADVPANVTLVIENDAGMVTQVPGTTQRECDKVASMLAPRKVAADPSMFCGSNGVLFNGYPTPAAPHTSHLTTSHCVTSTGKP